MQHIVDSDSSQTLAVHDARRGHDLAIQGPPGTGKSQTIANIIASAIADGKTVLFVARSPDSEGWRELNEHIERAAAN